MCLIASLPGRMSVAQDVLLKFGPPVLRESRDLFAKLPIAEQERLLNQHTAHMRHLRILGILGPLLYAISEQ